MTAPVDGGTSQGFGENPTANLPSDSWLIETFGNYQPNGHTGVDFPVPVGTPVRAVADGIVVHSGWYSGSYDENPYWIAPAFAGDVLVIDHGWFVGIYAHLSSSPIEAGVSVNAGQVVASSGNSGGSTGPHLHFEVLPNGWQFNNGMYGRVDPTPYMAESTIHVSGAITATGTATTTTGTEGDETMIVLATDGKSPQVWIGDGILRRPVWSLDTMSALQWLDSNKVLGPFYKGGAVQTIPDLNAIGIDLTALVGKDVNGK